MKDLIEKIVTEYNTDNKTATEDVISFIDEMSKYLIIGESPVISKLTDNLLPEDLTGKG